MKFVELSEAEQDQMFDALEAVETALNGLSLLQATYILGYAIAEQSQNKSELEELCTLIVSAGLHRLETRIDSDIDEVANELPV